MQYHVIHLYVVHTGQKACLYSLVSKCELVVQRYKVSDSDAYTL